MARSIEQPRASLAHRKVDWQRGVVAALAAVAFTTAGLWGINVPVLRHDWNWPVDASSAVSHLAFNTNGWSDIGFGFPLPVLTGYLIEPPLAAAILLLGAHWALVTFCFVIAALIQTGGTALATAMRLQRAAAMALGVVALFNPWTYNRIVAGHLFMLLAFGATLHLFAELLRTETRPRRISLLLCLIYAQLQFFLIAAVATAMVCARAGKRLPFLTLIIVSAPTAIGLLFSFHRLAETPLLTSWQLVQSSEPRDAILLRGYFAQYDQVLPAYVQWSTCVLAFLALAGVPALTRSAERWVAGGCIFLLVASTGLRGPFAPVYSQLVEHVKLVGVFRELYDLAAFTIVGYVLLAAAALRRWPILRPPIFVAAAAAFVGWISASPSRFFVDAAAIPHPEIRAAPNTRFALFPAFQPLRFRGNGSGIDPDAFDRPNDIAPLNTYLPAYPNDAALAAWAQSRDARPLQALGVSSIVERPWFTENPQPLANMARVDAQGPAKHSEPNGRTIPITPAPELIVAREPHVVAIPSKPGAGAVFFTDDVTGPSRGSLRVLKPAEGALRADLRWIGAPFAYHVYPEMAQGIGGVFTTSAAPLPVRSGLAVLAMIRGRLEDNAGRLVGHDTPGYEWLHTAPGVSQLICRGRCTIIGEGQRPLGVPDRVRTDTVRSLAAQSFSPWLLEAQLPAGSLGVVRLNNSYAEGWLAIAGGALLRHVRIDSVSNGWYLPRVPQVGALWVVYLPAAGQCVAEITSGIWLGYLCWLAGRSAVCRLRAR